MNYLKFHEQTIDGGSTKKQLHLKEMSASAHSRLHSPRGSLKGALFDISHDIPYGQYRKTMQP